jgi:hypothetical protein
VSEERGALHSASLTVGKTGTSSGGGGIKKSIGSVTKPGSEEGKKADSTEEAEDTEKTEAGKKATGKEDANQATTVKPESATNKAVANATKKSTSTAAILEGVNEAQNPNSKEAWQNTGAETGARNNSTDEIAMINSDQLSQRDRGQILNDFPRLQETLSTTDKLIGGFKSPDSTARPQSQAGPNPSSLGQGGRGQGGGAGPIIIQNQAVAVSGSSNVGSAEVVIESQPAVEVEEAVDPLAGLGDQSNA